MASLKRPRSPRSPTWDKSDEPDAKRFRTTTPPRVHATFSDLASDVQFRVFSALSVGDLHNARLSGIVPAAIAGMVAAEFKRKLAEIQTVRSMLPAKGYTKEKLAPPTEFVKIKKLRLTTLRYADRTDILSDGIGHFTALRELNLSSFDVSLGSLPDLLPNCGNLCRLSVRANHFAKFPKVILKLKRLTHLDLSQCTDIDDDIPENIGKCLPLLKVFGIAECAFRIIPKSLIRTLERNLGKGKAKKSKYTPLLVSPNVFRRGYLRDVIDKRKYPKLAAKCEHIFMKNDEEQAAGNGGAGEAGEAQFEDVDEII